MFSMLFEDQTNHVPKHVCLQERSSRQHGSECGCNTAHILNIEHGDTIWVVV